jgi:serine/threonine protein kinase
VKTDIGLDETHAAGSALEETQAGSDPGIPVPGVQAPGKKLGRFTLVERLGAGAMGVVWRAEDPNLGRHVALKLLRRADEDLTERLVREARAMAQVNHPNVVTVYEVGQAEDGTNFIAMELVTGQSLRAWQQAQRRSTREIVAVYIAAARGLAAAHAAGIVHRDFKPDNVLVGSDGRVHVTDFGLAAAKPGDAADAAIRPKQISDVNLTTSGSVLGTPAYMAPEQFTGGNVDPRTDQFNFCVALYEALYGQRPFSGSSFSELGDNVMYGRIEAPPPAARVSAPLRAIVVRGLSVKPNARFATMHALIHELGRDRARPWRFMRFAAGAVAAALALGLVADWSVRDRLRTEINQSFTLTGKQLERAVAKLTDQFNTFAQVVYKDDAVREVAGHHDQADFGLGSPDDDRVELERLHSLLASNDWYKLGSSELAIGDYKGRLMYASAAPNELGADLTVLPSVKRALDEGKGNSVSVVPYADPALASTHIAPAAAHDGLAFLFVRSLALGAHEGSEARALYVQLQDGKQLLEDVRLDDKTLLALVAPSGDAVRDPGLSPAAVHEALAALATGAVTEIHDASTTYQVQARAIRGLDGKQTIAHVVMARPLDGVLALFPGARIVFALTAFCALVLAAFAWLRVRRVSR